MLQVTLGEKTYTAEYVSALALREIGKPLEIIRRREDEAQPGSFEKDLDILVSWFCVLFGNQFKPGEVYEKYPADRLIPDVALAVMAVSNRVSNILSTFPTTAAAARTADQANG